VKLIKTNLVQAQEYTREMNDMLVMLDSYKNKINKSLAVPSWLLSDEDSLNKASEHAELEWYNIKYPHRQPNISVIDIDVTKIP